MSPTQSTFERRPPHILLADDNEVDQFLTRKAFSTSGRPFTMDCVDDGEQCLRYLRREPPYENVLRPDLVLLDLNMPRVDGRDVMQALMQDELLRPLPVIILTTSHSEKDRIDMFNLRCNAYMTKPLDFHDFCALVVSLYDYWFKTATLPPREGRE